MWVCLSTKIPTLISRYMQEDIKTVLKSQVSDSLYTSFDGTILWRIDQFDEVRSKAISGEQKSIFSPPFYTSRFG